MYFAAVEHTFLRNYSTYSIEKIKLYDVETYYGVWWSLIKEFFSFLHQ